jgi:peptide/nickel transport system ATP-binding protein
MNTNEPLLSCVELTKIYSSGLIRTKSVVGAKDVSFEIRKGDILSLVGESGSGKSTIARMILRLIKPTSGEIFYKNQDIEKYDKSKYYKHVQAIFQDPYSAFNPFFKIDRVLEKAFFLREDGASSQEKKDMIECSLKSVGLNPDEVLGRYPHQLSGGQMQRILIARFLVIESELLIADEPTSMIDASTRVGILNLLTQLRDKGKLTVLFITHDIGQAQYISDEIIVMKKGEVVEQGIAEDIFLNPKHPYTIELLESVPRLYERWDLS